MFRPKQKARLIRTLTATLTVVAVAGIGYLIYLGAAAWFRHEIRIASYELAQVQAQQTANLIAQALPKAFQEKLNRHLSPDDAFEHAMDELMARYPNVVATLIVERDGRIAQGRIAPTASKKLRRQLARLGPGLAGHDEDQIVDIIRDHFPSIDPVRIPIRYQKQLIASLRVFIDRMSTQDELSRAALRMGTQLALSVMIALALAGVALIVMNRQWRLARRLRSERDEAERLAYVGTLAAGLAHEIRNPLNALAMQLEMLEEDAEAETENVLTPRIQRIRTGLTSVERTVHSFLVYARPDRQRPTTIGLLNICEEVAHETVESCSQADAKAEVIVAPDLKAWCDPHALRQILGNLVSNALAAQREKPTPTRVRIEAQYRDRGVEIVVEDAGDGIAPNLREQVFECFFTTKSDGTGLGLAIARRLAEMNGGSLTVDDEPSPLGGARFRLRLALTAPASSR